MDNAPGTSKRKRSERTAAHDDGSTDINEPLMRMLRGGCAEVGVPDPTAMELLRFLTVKRVHQDGANGRPYRMSPSPKLDRLWHWVLLNTAVADLVHAYVGGRVSHSTQSAGDDDSVKLQRMMRSLALMERFGFRPSLELWREPSTLADTIERVEVDGRVQYRGVAPKGDLEDDGRDVFLVFVLTLDSRRFKIIVGQHTTVSDLRNIICACEGTPRDLQRLLSRGNQLGDDDALVRNVVEHNGVVDLVVRQRGC